jgi:preprotein translocase subunit YajC
MNVPASVLLTTAPGGAGGGNPASLLFLAVFVFILYFFMIRPQAKKAKEQRTFIDGLEKGQRVVTSGGIHGRILQVDEGSVLLEVDKGFKIRVEKTMISSDFSRTGSETGKAG